MEIPLILPLLMVALAASAPPSDSQERASVCSIRADPQSYIGKIVTITASYATDSRHYQYLEDPGCSNGTLDIGFRVPERDSSVSAFDRAQETLCTLRGTPHLCVLEGTVTVRGAVAEATGAHLQPDLTYQVINLHSVTQWEFKDGP